MRRARNRWDPPARGMGWPGENPLAAQESNQARGTRAPQRRIHHLDAIDTHGAVSRHPASTPDAAARSPTTWRARDGGLQTRRRGHRCNPDYFEPIPSNQRPQMSPQQSQLLGRMAALKRFNPQGLEQTKLAEQIAAMGVAVTANQLRKRSPAAQSLPLRIPIIQY
jgi:hypothetical protein